VNARDAMPAGGQLTISVENTSANDLDAHVGARAGPHVTIQVEDEGAGIADTNLEKIFDPFFTTKEVGKGTGLGLSTSLAIVKSHGGVIRVSSEVGKGTRFRIYLPARTAADMPELDGETAELPRGNGETVLVVDDEASIRQVARQTLEAFGYRVLTAADGAQAVAVFAQHHAEIAVVLTDMMMPVMDGGTAIQVLLKMKPSVRIIAASGLALDAGVTGAAGAAVKHFLPKPYTVEVVLKVLKQVLAE
jgi:CheY-like chemotaxis protein